MSYRRHSLSRGTPCCHPAREGRANERWSPAGGVVVQVDGHSAPRKYGGEIIGCKEIDKRSRRFKDGGQ